jgi:hypothetical protein
MIKRLSILALPLVLAGTMGSAYAADSQEPADTLQQESSTEQPTMMSDEPKCEDAQASCNGGEEKTEESGDK